MNKQGDDVTETEVKGGNEGQKEEENVEPERTEWDERDKKINELTSTLQYLQAEFENFKKRTAKDFEGLIKYSNEGLILKLLPILDDFEASLGSTGNEKAFEGFRLIYGNFMDTLKAVGLEEIKTLGEAFDPFKHEAVLEVDLPEKKENEIVDIVQKGYMYKSKVIRASKVKVVKHHVEEEKGDEETDVKEPGNGDDKDNQKEGEKQ
ncbi:MAG: nucleotide exchange factor GrpE [Thermoplasmata archaeon]|nr:nucleotide exchange factor GrpE [Thermoplasmata archaeon]